MIWGPWILHDGKGCPLRAGVFCQIEIVLSCEDEWGGGKGISRFQELRLSEDDCNNPMWTHANFGEPYHYTSGPFAGRGFFCGKIIRYRLRRPPAIDLLTEIAADPTREIDAPEGPARAPDEVPA